MNLSKEVQEILLKYNQQEGTVDKLLIQSRISNESESNEAQGKSYPTLEEAMKRNKELFKDLETVKGNLRSKAIYSPSEMQWEFICKQYQAAPS